MLLNIDDTLNKISLAFGMDSLNIVLEDGVLVSTSLYHIANIDESDLDRELVYQAKLHVLFNGLLVVVTKKYTSAKYNLDYTEAQVTIDIENKIARKDKDTIDAYGDRKSDKKLELIVQCDQRYRSALEEMLKWEDMVTTFKAMLSSIEKRGDMLTQLSTKRNKIIGSRVEGIVN